MDSGNQFDIQQAIAQFIQLLSPSAARLLIWLVENDDKRDILLEGRAVPSDELQALARELHGRGCCEAATLLLFRMYRGA